jgi:predicted membrane channel-forming protein YqfA (hemolysin III family)
MWTPDEILRIMLFACLFGMVMVAIFYLRQRKLSTLAYLLWGLFAVVVPVLGPYLVIISRPGEPDR